jgi:glycosyltransferase involved in cell wall biosynthesis
MKSILLITHDTSLTGAPKSVLLLFEELKKQGYKITTVALRGGGQLEKRFRDISEKYYRIDQFSKTVDYSVYNRIRRLFLGHMIQSDLKKCIDEIVTNSFDIIYANTIVSLKFASELKIRLKAKLILHVHELETVIEEFCPDLFSYDKWVDSFIVPSYLNEKILVDRYFISSNKISVIRETSDFQLSDYTKKKDDTKINVLMCGGAYWRKGDDLFLLIAKSILKLDSNYNFFWVGKQSEERKRVNNADIHKMGLSDNVFFIDETLDPMSWYLNSDLFLLTSREDPFPLAAVEAGMLGLPIFCFEDATGISEVIHSSCVLPYLDIEAMANQIITIYNNKSLLGSIEKQNKTTFQEFTPLKIAEQITFIFEQ